MKKLIFDTEIRGHHLEYLHHIYMGAMNDNDNSYIFAIPDSFDQYKMQYEWPESANISFYFIPESVIRKWRMRKKTSYFYESFYARKIINLMKVDEVFFITLMQVIPILPYIINKKIKISGIIYSVEAVCENNRYGILRNFLEQIRFKTVASRVSKAYILNDKLKAEELNKTFKTQIFKFLPDPIPQNAFSPYSNSDHSLKINHETVFLHFGYMRRRKGTLDILKAISMLPEDMEASFIFAGTVDTEIKKEFYELVEMNQDRDIIVIDKYCDYDFFNDLCFISDCILIPYHLTNQSSGVIGYAAAHHIPVIGPKDGLIGFLIQSNNLGHTIEAITPKEIARAIQGFKKYRIDSDYVKTNSIDNFVKSILK